MAKDDGIQPIYKVVVCYSTRDLENEITYAIRDGWKLAGGISTVVYGDDKSGYTREFVQAVYKI